MRTAIRFTIAFFIGVLVLVWIASESARPVILDIDPAAVDAKHG